MVNDPIADLLIRIKNGGIARKKEIRAPYSRIREAILKVLAEAGFIAGFQIQDQNEGKKKELVIKLKYDADLNHTIKGVKRVSTPGCRIYIRSSEIKKSIRGENRLGIISTSRGVLSHCQALAQNLGGELIAIVW